MAHILESDYAKNDETKKLCLITILMTGLHLTACQTDLNRPYDLNAYLQQFIGQSSTDIQENLNFKQLGYQSNAPQLTQNQLVYTVYRPLNIPIPQTGVVLGTMQTGASSYDVNFQCKIIFELKQNTAQSVHYFGKAC